MLSLQLLEGLEAGTDEAGRGCLAGPVTAAAVILPPDFDEPLLNAAINQIIASGKMLPQVPNVIQRDFTDAKATNPLRTEMYVEHK